MKEILKLSEVFPVTAKRLYDAWLNSEEHTNFTGGSALIDPKSGGRFTVWNDSIHGKNIELQPYGRIVQSWRSTDFPAGVRDSRIEILFEKVDGGTRMTLIHTEIPQGQENEFKKVWTEHYFKSMKKYFKGNN